MNEPRQCGLADGSVIWQEWDGEKWSQVDAPPHLAGFKVVELVEPPRRGRKPKAAA